MLEVELSDQDYLRQIELLSRDVVDAAQDEGSLAYGSDPDDATTLQRAVNELARHLRREHFAGDGCVEDDRPLQHLGGAAVISPSDDPAAQASYLAGCSRLGVEARVEGWALWYTWDDKARAHTMVTTALETTRGLLRSWSLGHDLQPAQPLRTDRGRTGLARTSHSVAKSRDHDRLDRTLAPDPMARIAERGRQGAW